MKLKSIDSFSCVRPLPGSTDIYFSLPHAQAAGTGPLATLRYSMRVLAKHLLRHEDGATINAKAIRAFVDAAKSCCK